MSRSPRRSQKDLWRKFDLRHYDPQIGRWATADPYNEFASPYLGMGNSLGGVVDPDGGWSNPVQAFIVQHYAPALIVGAISAIYTKGGKWDKLRGFGIGFGVGMGASYLATSVNWASVGGSLGDAGNWLGGLFQDRYWHPLYKSVLINYFNTTDNNVLGFEFENLFAEYSKKYPPYILSNVRKYSGPKFLGGDRNTIPDFIGDAYGNNLPIYGADWYEMKQKQGGLYLSSNLYQLKGHIDNLKRSNQLNYERFPTFKAKLYLITTADVKFSKSIAREAALKNVLYDHIHAEYRRKKGQMEFRFKNPAPRGAFFFKLN